MTKFTVTAQSFISAARVAKVIVARDDAAALLIANRELDGKWYVIAILPV